ncbi:MAG: hypothetical protein KAQ63_02980 [Candidatus Moranbacteria bacterium]|nr:hypothetical protein [Candidatus Moranbacteria bacterium]
MGFFNFGKKNDDKKDQVAEPKTDAMMNKMDDMLDGVDTSKMSRKERWALKLFKKMPKAKREEAMRKAMNPQNILKEKDKILKQLDEMVKSGQMSKQEVDQLKSQLGLR